MTITIIFLNLLRKMLSSKIEMRIIRGRQQIFLMIMAGDHEDLPVFWFFGGFIKIQYDNNAIQ